MKRTAVQLSKYNIKEITCKIKQVAQFGLVCVKRHVDTYRSFCDGISQQNVFILDNYYLCNLLCWKQINEMKWDARKGKLAQKVDGSRSHKRMSTVSHACIKDLFV